MTYDRSLCQWQPRRSIFPASAPTSASSSSRVAPKVCLFEEKAVPVVHVEEKAAGREVDRLQDVFYPVLRVPESSALPVKALLVSTSHWKTTAFYR